MKKIITGALLFSSFLISGNVDSEIIKKIKTLKPLNTKEISIKDAKKIGSIYILRLSINEPRGKRLVPAVVTEDFQHVVIGNSYNSTSGNIESTMEMSQYDEDIAFTLGSSNKNGSFYVFIDPDCPACKNFESDIKTALNNAGIQLHFMFYPLDGVHPDARKKSQYILSLPKEERKEAYEKMQGGDMSWKTANISPEAVKSVEKMVEIGNDLGLMGTPSLYGEKANEVDLDVFYAYLRALEKKEKGEVK